MRGLIYTLGMIASILLLVHINSEYGMICGILGGGILGFLMADIGRNIDKI